MICGPSSQPTASRRSAWRCSSPPATLRAAKRLIGPDGRRWCSGGRLPARSGSPSTRTCRCSQAPPHAPSAPSGSIRLLCSGDSAADRRSLALRSTGLRCNLWHGEVTHDRANLQCPVPLHRQLQALLCHRYRHEAHPAGRRRGSLDITAKPARGASTERHKANRHGKSASLSNEHEKRRPRRNLPDLSWVGSMAHSAQVGFVMTQAAE